MKKGLVSIVTPCYNCEKYLPRYFDSILRQTYRNLQVIFVDDGSTDGSGQVAREYKERFDEAGMDFHYVRKENGGAASAINAALPLVEGEYMIWPDCDDWLTKDSVQVRVRVLEINPDINLTACSIAFYDENDFDNIKSEKKWETYRKNIFEDILLGDVIFFSGIYMVRSGILFDKLGGRKISDIGKVVGQNWQLLLPIAFNNDCICLPDILHNVTYRYNSWTHSTRDKNTRILLNMKKKELMSLILSNILMTDEQRDAYFKKFQIKNRYMFFINELYNEDRNDNSLIKDFEEFFLPLKELNGKLVYIWGAGKTGKYLKEWLFRTTMRDITGFIDTDEKKCGIQGYCGKPVYAPDGIPIGGQMVIIALPFYDSILNYIKKRKMVYGKDYVWPSQKIYEGMF